MRIVILIWFILLPSFLFSQKKVIPVDTSQLTGITLPPHSTQDKRMLSVLAARKLLQLESKKSNVEIGEVEVFTLPDTNTSGYSSDELVEGIEENGWQIKPSDIDNRYAWLQKENNLVLAFFETGKKSTSLYFGQAKNPTAFSDPSTTVGMMSTQNNETIPETIIRSPEESNTSPMIPAQTGFTFHTTNWDDGWVSTIQSDRVVVTKGAVKVYVYFPIAHNDETRRQGRDYYWDNYIAKEFRILTKQYQDKGEVMGMFQPPYIEGQAIDPATGRNCFLGFHVSSGSGIMYPTLVVAPDAATLWATFPKANDLNSSDISVMRNYNKFAIAQSDLTGTWDGGDFGAMNYYNAYSGNYLGMSAVAMSDEFTFNADGTYSSKHSGGSGMVGSMQTYSQNYKGKATVSNWEIILPGRYGGKTSTYYAYFEIVNGGRVLHLQDKQYSGTKYALIRKQ
ncbi:MAG: hypothetical protein H3C36_05905 [Chitinophagaceae bacterium]|nr:hypothetical protein [Chitinophagaceae bacterium]MCW5915191.1 hypothetical protein [Chitinophagaceae bacterium]MCZ2396473.1 hypothetical protein [Chitinophagales bacterium]